MDGASRDSWLGRPLLVGAVLTVLVAVVVFAAHGHVVSGGGGGANVSTGIVNSLVSALLALYVVGGIVLFSLLVWSKGQWNRKYGRTAARQRTVSGLALAFVLLAALLLGGDRLRNRFAGARTPQTPTVQKATPTNEADAKHRRARQSHFELGPFLAVLGGLAAAGAVLYLTTRGPRGGRDDTPLPPILAEKIEVTLHDLRTEPDPRRAVIAAYRRMEQLLEESGIPREPSETPLEYMSRALVALGGGSRAVRALTRLFERARFSSHPVDEGMKRDAIVAVEALQRDIAAAEAAAEAAA